MRQLDDADLRVGLEPAERERDADLVVVARPRPRPSAQSGQQSAARMSFVDVLPVEPVMPTTRALDRSRTARPERARGRRRHRRGTSVAAAPRASASSTNSAPPADRNEEVARLDAARVDLHAGDLVGVRRSLEAPRPRTRPRRARAGSRGAPQRAAAPPARRRGRRTGRSRPASSCPCSWPLPAITTTSPCTRDLERPRDRGAPVGLDLDVGLGAGHDLVDDRLGLLAARVVGGDDRQVGELARRSGPSAAAWRGRGRRRSRTRRSAGRRRARAPCASTFSSESGRVRVVDEHRERLALVDGLEAAGHAARRASMPARDRLVRRCRAARAPATAPSTFSTLNRPRRRVSQLDPGRA